MVDSESGTSGAGTGILLKSRAMHWVTSGEAPCPWSSCVRPPVAMAPEGLSARCASYRSNRSIAWLLRPAADRDRMCWGSRGAGVGAICVADFGFATLIRGANTASIPNHIGQSSTDARQPLIGALP